jgi:ribulose-5-phosphate 4-epimerase/fuculose-1-phosphate aldolase
MKSPVESLIEDLVDANRILAHLGVCDAFGHVSGRHPEKPNNFLLARNLAPGLVTAADLVEYDVATGEALGSNPPRLYLERFIHSEIYRVRPDVMAVVHNHSPAVIPFTVAKGARFRPVCHMSGFLGAGAPLFEIRDAVGDGSDILIRDRPLGAALASRLGDARVVLMRGHGCTVVAESVRLAVYRAYYTEVNAKLQLQAQQLGELEALTKAESEAAMRSTEGQIDRPWNLWRDQARAATAA